MASNWAAGLVVKNLIATNQNTPRIRIKPFKDQISTSGNLSAPIAYPVNIPVGTPQYGLNSLYAIHPDLEIDALSTGNGVIPVPDGNGIPNIAGWMAVTASVANDAIPPSGSHFANGLAQRGGPGAEMVSYYMNASAGINPLLVGRQTMEMNADHMGVDPTTTTLDQDIIAFDYGLGLYTSGLSRPGSPLFPNNDRVYFSVSSNFVTGYQGGVFAKKPNAQGILVDDASPHAANIYMMLWNSNTSSWGDVIVYASWELLGFGVYGDLDALDIDPLFDTIVFSGTAASILESSELESQLSIIDLQSVLAEDYIAPNSANLAKSAMVLRDGPTSTPITVVKAIGGGDLDSNTEKEIDSVCTTDPHVSTIDSFDLGFPRGHNAAYGEPLGMSMVRFQSWIGPKKIVLGHDAWSVHVTGWGDVAPHDCNAYLVRYDGTGDLTQSIADLALLTDWTVIKSRPRSLQRDSFRMVYHHPIVSGVHGQVRLAVVQIHGSTGQRTATMVSTFAQ